MLNKIALAILLTLSIASVVRSEDTKNFDKGNNLQECMDNCRHHHREVLKLHRGSGKGMCWTVCREEHPMTKDTTEENDK